MYYTLTMFDDRPWECTPVSPEKGDDPTLFQYVEANDGWVPCSPPWTAVNDARGCPENPGEERQTGPCHRRERWWARTEAGNMSYSPFDGRFYCGRYIVVDCTDSKEAKWLLNDGNSWIGQTALASSYGLMQLLYTTAVDTGWRAGEDACNRHPFLLFNPEDNLNAGVGYVTTLLVEEVLKARELVLKEQGLWVGFLKQALGYYNAGKHAGRPNLDYANAVWDRVALYQPGF
jgi:hypothetical protein